MKSLRPILVPVLALMIVCGVAAAFVRGWDGVVGVLLGGLVVVLFLGSTPLALSPLVKANATLSLPVALGFLTTKAVAMLIILLLLFDVGGVAGHVDTTWFGVAAITASLAWTLLQIRAFQHARTPTYDLPEKE